MPERELKYMIVFTTQGEAKIVQATDELLEQNKAHQLARVSTNEYAEGLQNLKRNMAQISAPSKNLVKTQQQMSQQLDRVDQGMKNTGKSTAATNNLLIALTRGAQDAQFGMMGVANNLQQSAELAASASTQMGGMKNVVTGLAASFMNPATGLIVGVTAITTLWQMAESGAISFGNKIENLDEITGGYVDTIDQLIERMNDLAFGEDDFFSTEQLNQRLTMQKAIQTQEEQRLKVLQDEAKRYNEIFLESPKQYEAVMEDHQKVLEEIQFIEGFLEKTKEKQLELEGMILVKKRAMQNEDLARIEYGNQLLEITEKEDKMLSEWEDFDVMGQIAKDIEKMNEEMAEGEDPLTILGDPSDRLKDMEARMNAQLAFQKKIQEQRVQNARLAGNEIQALRLQEQQELNELANNELINERQREEMRLLIIEEYHQRELELERKRAEELKLLYDSNMQDIADRDQWMHDQRVNMASMATDTLLSINQAFLGDSKALTALLFGAEQAFQIANVLLDTKRKAAQAVMTGMALLSNPVTAPLAGNAFAQAAAITSTGTATAALMGAMTLARGAAMVSGGGNAGRGVSGTGGETRNPITDFRGIDADSISGRGDSFPEKFTATLKNPKGQLLADLELAMDKDNEGAYVSS